MAYAVPKVWAQGDYPLAADINKYKSGLDAIHDLLGDQVINIYVTRRIGTVQGFYLVHRNRWLTYRGVGTIEDPSGVGEEVSLPDTGSNWVSYDLAGVEWMVPGSLYQVQGVYACWEDVDPL